jgi:ABC-2 type transport system permease protein
MRKKPTIVRNILIAICIIFALNWIGNSSYVRFDLTEDNRYTLSDATKSYLSNIQDTIRFSVYLHGDLPVTFTKMKRDVSDFLEEIKRIGGSRIHIKYIDPLNIGTDNKSNKAAFNRLIQNYGLRPYTIQEQDESGKFEQRFIIPGIIVSTSSSFVPINLFSDVIGTSTEEQVYEALGKLEYLCLKSIKQLTQKRTKKIAYITNHKELSSVYVYDALKSLQDFYDIDKISTRQLLDSLTSYDMVMIAQPTSKFSEEDKFILDQYIMNNGNLFCFFDNVRINADTLQYVSEALAIPRDINISDFLFHLGVRINSTILLDNQCAKVPLNISPPGMQPNYQGVPWYYYPLLRGNKNHRITQDISLVKSQFANTIDTTVTGNGNLQKTVLLSSSAYAREIQAPIQVGFSILQRIGGNYFNSYYVPVAILNEGTMNSFFEKRSCPIPAHKLPEDFSIKMQSDSNKMVFVADGDIIKNEVEIKGFDTIPKPLHFYKYVAVDNKLYTGNKEFILNVANYICGDSEFIPLRTQEMKIRLLNEKRILKERKNWQLFNIAVPLLLLTIIGTIIMVIRKRKYSQHVS